VLGAEVRRQLQKRPAQVVAQLRDGAGEGHHQVVGLEQLALVADAARQLGAKLETGPHGPAPAPHGGRVGDAVVGGVQLQAVELPGVIVQVIRLFDAQWEVRAQPFLVRPDGAAHVQGRRGGLRRAGAGQQAGGFGVVGRQAEIDVAQVGQAAKIHAAKVGPGPLAKCLKCHFRQYERKLTYATRRFSEYGRQGQNFLPVA